jgi:hypothetical protein
MKCYECQEWDFENELCKQGYYQFSCKEDIQESFSDIKDLIPERDVKLIDYHNLYRGGAPAGNTNRTGKKKTK